MTHDDIRSLEIAVMFRSYSDSTDRIAEAYEIVSSLRRARERDDLKLDGPRRRQIRAAQLRYAKRAYHTNPTVRAKSLAASKKWQRENRDRMRANAQRRYYANLEQSRAKNRAWAAARAARKKAAP